MCAVAIATVGSLLPSAPTRAATSANLDQCANGSFANQDPSPCQSANEWVNGNLGGSKAHYREGEAIPYRLVMGDVATDRDVDLIIEWDTTKQGKHAIDYLTSYDHPPTEDADPCVGVTPSPCASSTEFSIPADPQVTEANVVQDAGEFTLFGGQIKGVSEYRYPRGPGFDGDKSAQITITFRALVANPIMAWGGHIAERGDWQPAGSASSISGSPYHMRLIDLDGSGGNQDRSLATSAIVNPAIIRIVKDAVPGVDPQDFVFSAAPGLSPASFTLDDDGDDTNDHSSFQDYSVATVARRGSTYTVTETPVNGWTPTVNCTEDVTQDSTKNGTNVATINLQASEFVTCTFTNTRQPGKLTVIKHVINDGVPTPGTADASDFTMSVTGNNPDPASFPGSETGTVVLLDPGPYSVNETGPSGYERSDSGDCESSIAAGEEKTCTITNNDTDLTVEVTKTPTPGSVQEPDGTVSFEVNVKNTSTVPLRITKIEDTDFSPVNGDSDCQVGTVLPAGGECSFTFTGQVSGNAGDVHSNTVTVTLTDETRTTTGQGTAIVPITGRDPSISVVKDGPATIAEPGGSVIYTVTVTNTSASSDPVEITSLTDEVDGVVTPLTGDEDCHVGTFLQPSPGPGSSCTFQFTGTVSGPAGTTKTDKVTVEVVDDDDTKTTDDDEHTVTIVCVFVPGNAANATASGNAYAAKIDVPLLNIHQIFPSVPVTSSQAGVGDPPATDKGVAKVRIAGIAELRVLAARSDAQITPVRATDQSEASVAQVDLLNGTVVAEAVTASATANATGAGASTESFDSTIAKLTVAGIPVANIKPGLVVAVPDVGELHVYERVNNVNVSNPNVADLTVNMLRLTVTLGPLSGTEIVISHAEAHASFPANKVCGAQPDGTVSGDAAIANVRLSPPLAAVDVVTAGSLPESGGSDLTQVAHVGPLFAPTGTKVLEAQAATAKTEGAFDGVESRSQSQAEVASAELLKMGLDPALLFAQAVESHSSATANAGGASSSGSTTLVNVTLNGTNVCNQLGLAATCQPPPNSQIVDGFVLLRLNEQITNTVGNTTEITVNAIHLFIIGEDSGVPVADIVIGRSHSDACFAAPGSDPCSAG